MTITHLLVLLLLLIHLFYATGTAYSADAPEAAAPEGGANFIRSSCGTTLYPEICYHSLAGYATTIQQDPARLARVAVGVSLSRASRMAFYVANLTRQVDYGADPRAASAIHDCFSLFRDAVDQIRGSLKQMRELNNDNSGKEELRFQMSNVQTWMSAALTNEDTCTDGFEDVRDGTVKEDVCDRTAKAKQVTSNALALVNSFVAKVINVP